MKKKISKKKEWSTLLKKEEMTDAIWEYLILNRKIYPRDPLMYFVIKAGLNSPFATKSTLFNVFYKHRRALDLILNEPHVPKHKRR